MAEMRFYKVGFFGTHLALRSQARQIRDDLLRGTLPGDTTVLDFAGVEAITNGFADELLGAGVPGRRVVIQDATDAVREAITTVLARRGLAFPDEQTGTPATIEEQTL